MVPQYIWKPCHGFPDVLKSIWTYFQKLITLYKPIFQTLKLVKTTSFGGALLTTSFGGALLTTRLMVKAMKFPPPQMAHRRYLRSGPCFLCFSPKCIQRGKDTAVFYNVERDSGMYLHRLVPIFFLLAFPFGRISLALALEVVMRDHFCWKTIVG